MTKYVAVLQGSLSFVGAEAHAKRQKTTLVIKLPDAEQTIIEQPPEGATGIPGFARLIKGH